MTPVSCTQVNFVGIIVGGLGVDVLRVNPLSDPPASYPPPKNNHKKKKEKKKGGVCRPATIHFSTIWYVSRYSCHDTIHDTIRYITTKQEGYCLMSCSWAQEVCTADKPSLDIMINTAQHGFYGIESYQPGLVLMKGDYMYS